MARERQKGDSDSTTQIPLRRRLIPSRQGFAHFAFLKRTPHPFQSLPTEIRHRIWRYAFPHRIIDLWANCRPRTEVTSIKSQYADISPPAVLHACKESREVALRDYTLEHWVMPLSSPDEEGELEQGQLFYINYGTDTLCLLRGWTCKLMQDLGPLMRRFRKVAVEDCMAVEELLVVHVVEDIQEKDTSEREWRLKSRFEGLDEITVLADNPIPIIAANELLEYGRGRFELLSDDESFDPIPLEKWRGDLYQHFGNFCTAKSLQQASKPNRDESRSERRSEGVDSDGVPFPRLKLAFLDLPDMPSESKIKASKSRVRDRDDRSNCISDRITQFVYTCVRYQGELGIRSRFDPRSQSRRHFKFWRKDAWREHFHF